MNLKWPMKNMRVGDFAVISNATLERVKAYCATYSGKTGTKYECKRRDDEHGNKYIFVWRINDDGTRPPRDPKTAAVFYMDAAVPPERRAAREQARQQARERAIEEARQAAIAKHRALEGRSFLE